MNLAIQGRLLSIGTCSNSDSDFCWYPKHLEGAVERISLVHVDGLIQVIAYLLLKIDFSKF